MSNSSSTLRLLNLVESTLRTTHNNQGSAAQSDAIHSICVGFSLLYASIWIIKITSGVEVQIKNWGQDVLRTKALIASKVYKLYHQKKKSERLFTQQTSWGNTVAEKFIQTFGTSEQN